MHDGLLVFTCVLVHLKQNFIVVHRSFHLRPLPPVKAAASLALVTLDFCAN